MEVYEPPTRWQWIGRIPTVKVHYDHRVEPVDADHTRLVWTVDGEGLGAGSVGRLFGAFYGRNLDHSIPRLPAELRRAER